MKNRKIMITGANGYIGLPLYQVLKRKHGKENVIGVDNNTRSFWVRSLDCISATVPKYPDEIVNLDLRNSRKVKELLKEHKPDVIINLAAQPSAPYSEESSGHATFTQNNNMSILRNFLWGLKELNMHKDTHLVHATTTGIYGAPNKKIEETSDCPLRGGSWYHMAKCFDTRNLGLANKQWKQAISDVRVSIVYGAKYKDITTRFDFDYWFGVVAHRFMAQALAGYPLTVYGKGKQRKPFVYLGDVVDSFVNLAEQDWKKGQLKLYNQTAQAESINELASQISNNTKCEVKHIPNPRVENEEHQMEIANDNFVELLGREPVKLKEGIKLLHKQVKDLSAVFKRYKDKFLPDDLKEDKSKKK